jgi:uncharacterized repeat protein (TIGR03843 family)
MTEAEPDLLEDELVLTGRIMPASNATFAGLVGATQVVYKPIAGERPLWDFPHGTLAGREVAAYLISRALGWDVVPHTWLRDGPHGPGMVQVWQETDPDHEAVTLVPHGEVPPGWFHVFDGLDSRDRPISLVHEDSEPLRRMAVFDVLANNADRKGGHVLEMSDGHRYGVDHGICMHAENKLRTVLWGWAGIPLTDADIASILVVQSAVEGALGDELADHVTDREITALARRCARLVANGVLPTPRGDYPPIPWPPF